MSRAGMFPPLFWLCTSAIVPYRNAYLLCHSAIFYPSELRIRVHSYIARGDFFWWIRPWNKTHHGPVPSKVTFWRIKKSLQVFVAQRTGTSRSRQNFFPPLRLYFFSTATWVHREKNMDNCRALLSRKGWKGQGKMRRMTVMRRIKGTRTIRGKRAMRGMKRGRIWGWEEWCDGNKGV